MTEPASSKPAEFDGYAGDYDAALAQGLSVSGEDKNYFAKGRIDWTARILRKLGVNGVNVMDFGCGTGSATPFFLQWPSLRRFIGTDVSAASLDVAKREHGSERARFALMKDYKTDGSLDLVYCNGVFHHIPLAERAAAVRYVYDSLRPGGVFALWENNPWNPGTRLVMSRIPFDRDAVTLPPPECRRLVRGGGFEIVRTDFLFIFPRILKWLRPLERVAMKVPAGGQYVVVGRRPRNSIS
jgi:SAM-dependent methyltransferase